MAYIHVCPKCHATIKYPTTEHRNCPDCNYPMASIGITDEKWAELSMAERNRIRKEESERLEREQALERERLQQQAIEKENKKTEFAKSFNDYYEYDVATVFNKHDGLVNAEALKNVLSQYASKGWKLHTMYSNELGKNALSVMGYGTNSTVCQDVLIFERRIQDDSVR